MKRTLTLTAELDSGGVVTVTTTIVQVPSDAERKLLHWFVDHFVDAAGISFLAVKDQVDAKEKP